MRKILFKTNSIQFKLCMYFLIIIIVPLLAIGMFSFWKFKDIISQKTIQSTQQLVDQTTRNLDFVLNEVEKVTFTIFAEKQIRNILQKGPAEDLKEKLYRKDIIQYILYNSITYRDDMDSIFIIDEERNIYYSAKDFDIANDIRIRWLLDYSKVFDANGKVVWLETHLDEFAEGSPKYVISAARVLKNFENSRRLGLLIANIEEQKLNDICNKVEIGKTSETYLVNNSGKIISHTNKKKINQFLEKKMLSNFTSKRGNFIFKSENEHLLIVYSKSDYTGFITISQIPMTEILKDTVNIKCFIIYTGIATIIAAFLIALMFSSSITNPIKNLVQNMKNTENGDFSIRIKVSGSAEIQSLNRGFNRMVEKVEELISRVYAEQNAKKEAELQALQAQINPHFLYNTLNSIKWMALFHNMQNISEMVSALTNLLHNSISNSKDFITIKEELKSLNDYVLIQKYRYNDKFQVTFEYEESILEYRILKLLLQPIVENAIFHGIENKKGNGNIKIMINTFGDKIKFVIQDDGIGMTTDTIERVMDKKANAQNQRGFSGIGIRNVDERIKLHFGEDFGLRIYSTLGAGTTVEVCIPLLK